LHAPRAFYRKMDDVNVPPFERLYEAHAAEILGYLRRVAATGEAEDAFQETFLRALRGYDAVTSADNLRAWLFTIATRVAIDHYRRRTPVAAGIVEPDGASEQELPAYAEIEHLTAELPPTERAAVVLHYAYDLPYAEIGQALGSSEDAARQAASSGVRRLRRRLT
jgi:RNA polymerase sigma factor (sigma-70 family)